MTTQPAPKRIRKNQKGATNMKRGTIALCLGLACIIVAGTAQAQFSASYQTNVISGFVGYTNAIYKVGSFGLEFDQLIITNGGELLVYGNNSAIGYLAANNSAVVSGTGSVWSTSYDFYMGWSYGQGGSDNNSLVIKDGGVVNNQLSYIGYHSSRNNAVVTGSGSAWNNRVLMVGYAGGAGNSLVISDGGAVTDIDGYVGYQSDNNSALVTGGGSVWSIERGGDLSVGFSSSGNSLVISNGGLVGSAVTYIGISGTNNSVVVSGNGSVLGNSFGLRVGWQGGSNNSLVVNNGGTVEAASISVAPNNLVTLSGGNIVGNDVVISNNAVLKGTGTIYANLTLAGTLAPGSPAGAITNFGNLTLRSSAVLDFELGGTLQGIENDFIRVNGGVATLDGVLRVSFINGFETNALNSETFTLLMADSTLSGSFTNAISGSRLTTTGGEGSFLVSYSGNNLVLSNYEAVPEPSTFALAGLGAVVLLGGCRMIRRAP
jgi:T5SS/PEP-CTERM-associated repeat protein